MRWVRVRYITTTTNKQTSKCIAYSFSSIFIDYLLLTFFISTNFIEIMYPSSSSKSVTVLILSIVVLPLLIIHVRPSHQEELQRQRIDINCRLHNKLPCNQTHPHCIVDTCQSCHQIFHLPSTSVTPCSDHLNVMKPENTFIRHVTNN